MTDDLEGFEEFNGYRRVNREAYDVSFKRNGQIHLTRECYEKLDCPERVDLFFNREKSIVAMRKGRGLLIKYNSTVKKFVVCVKSFMAYYNMEIEHSEYFSSETRNGVLYVEVSRIVKST